ncbi:MAG: enoyl-CoA hydratase, partial [Novosphingobium sp.]|nr:enoyl-CoA hydratase [Novosphingobium sp.]
MMMLATGKLFPAAHALAIGLINEVHEPEALDAAVDALAAEIAGKAGSVLRRGKASFARQAGLPLAEAYAFARAQALENIVDPDAREGIAAFLEKRQPVWPGG